jgi:integrase/recombinase XerD
MLMPAIDAYLAIRRTAGFRLRVTEALLRNYARFAIARGETHVRAQTAFEWAALAPSGSQRGRRLEAVRIFARHLQAEDTQHEVPPRGVFPHERLPYCPFIFTAVQIRQLLEQAARLQP